MNANEFAVPLLLAMRLGRRLGWRRLGFARGAVCLAGERQSAVIRQRETDDFELLLYGSAAPDGVPETVATSAEISQLGRLAFFEAGISPWKTRSRGSDEISGPRPRSTS